MAKRIKRMEFVDTFTLHIFLHHKRDSEPSVRVCECGFGFLLYRNPNIGVYAVYLHRRFLYPCFFDIGTGIFVHTPLPDYWGACCLLHHLHGSGQEAKKGERTGAFSRKIGLVMNPAPEQC